MIFQLKRKLRKSAKTLYYRLLSGRLGDLFNQIYTLKLTYAARKAKRFLPVCVIEQLKEAAKIEPLLTPNPIFLAQIKLEVIPNNIALGKYYAKLYQRLSQLKFDILKLDQGNIIINEQCVMLSKEIAGYSLEDQILVLAKLILQLKVPQVHIFDSRLGWELLKKFGMALSATTYFYVFFSEITTAKTKTLLPEIYLSVKQFICPNGKTEAYCVDKLGIPSTKFKSHFALGEE